MTASERKMTIMQKIYSAGHDMNRDNSITARQRSAFSDRVRFNWGYHDGADDARRKRIRHAGTHLFALPKDRAYCAGYELGIRDQKESTYCGDSSAAWEESQC